MRAQGLNPRGEVRSKVQTNEINKGAREGEFFIKFVTCRILDKASPSEATREVPPAARGRSRSFLKAKASRDMTHGLGRNQRGSSDGGGGVLRRRELSLPSWKQGAKTEKSEMREKNALYLMHF